MFLDSALHSLHSDLKNPHPLAVLHTRARCEKKIQSLFSQQGLTVYFPVELRRHQYGARQREYEIPVFPGYVFLRIPPDQESWVQQNQYIANCFYVHDEAKLLDELGMIQRALEGGAQVDVFQYLVEGQRVRIRSGPLKNIEGVIRAVGEENQLVLNLEMIQQSVAMKIDRTLIEPVY